MSLLAVHVPNGTTPSSGELTRLNSAGQFKPFVYLNGASGPAYLSGISALFVAATAQNSAHKEKSRLSAGFSCSRWVARQTERFPAEKASLAILLRALALAIRILLLLARLLAAALLLAGLLTRVLILLSRIR